MFKQEIIMNLFKKLGFLTVGLLALSLLTLGKSAFAVSYYGLSCTNKAYGTQHNSTSGLYIQAYLTLGTDESIGDSAGINAYLGRDCLYAGAGLTNSSAIVSGDVARSAANAIINSVTQRIHYAMAQNGDTAAHMSYSSNSNGIGMAANRLVGGVSVWANYTDSDFDNDQTFSNVRADSNKYDGDSSALSFGIDKKFGNILIGISGTSYDTDIDVSANKGTYSADGDTYGVYVGLNTGVIVLSAGYGVGDFDIDTERLDLGTGNTTITANGVGADVNYYHLAASAMIQRGRATFIPRLAYRNLDLDTDAFTESVPNDSNVAGPSGDNTTGTDATGKNAADISVAALSASSELLELGFNASLQVKGLTPFIDYASYKAELTTDGVTETGASDSSSYSTIGGGLNLNLRGRLTGTVAYYETIDRDDYSESTISATIRVNF